MDRRRAVRIAVAAMRRELRVIAFDAGVHDHYGARYPEAVRASKRSAELKAAIEQLDLKGERMQKIHLGFEVGTGQAVAIPLKHMVITGQTQEAGKTTTLEALIERSGLRALTFITKRGEGSFRNARRIDPHFREQADWQFVASILEASRGEKLKFERAWIIRASKGARTLADVQRNVRKAMETAKGMSADVYLTLDAYLEAVVPQIAKVKWAPRVELAPGVNVMDLTALNVEMQHLVIKSSLDFVLNHLEGTLVVVPEAWKFIPQGRGTPVKLAAESFIRQAAGLGNYLWLDSQDIAGVEKIVLKSVPLWILGVQREANEIKRTLDNIPAGIKKPKPDAVAQLSLGQFYACWGTQVHQVYVQPAWMSEAFAQTVAMGENEPAAAPAPIPVAIETKEEELDMDELKDMNKKLDHLISLLTRQAAGPMPPAQPGGSIERAYVADEDELYERIKARLLADAPALLLRLTHIAPEMTVEMERRELTVDTTTLYGQCAYLISQGFFDDPRENSDVGRELARRGWRNAPPNIGGALKLLVRNGFLTVDDGKRYEKVAGIKITGKVK